MGFINVSVLIAQLINFLILFFAFKYFVGDRITKLIFARRSKLEKLEKADAVYQEIVQRAEQEKKRMIEEGLNHKQKLIEEAKVSAKKEYDNIIEQARKQAKKIEEDAEKQTSFLQQELQDGFVSGVKKVTYQVVRKLFDKTVDLEEKYLDHLVHEFSNSGKQ